jgi:1A family penicillin-binding protein
LCYNHQRFYRYKDICMQPDPNKPRPYFEPPTVPMLPEDLMELPPESAPPMAPPPSRRGRNGKKPRIGCLRTVLTIAGYGLLVILGAGLIFGLLTYNSLSGELEQNIAELETLQGVEKFQTTRIYDRDGGLLYEIIDQGRRTEVPLDHIPISMRWATVATEDDTFYSNLGFDPPSIVRAAYQWLESGDIVSGASTITQQLVRQVVFSYEERNERTMRRKLKEAALAWVMTQKYSKDHILELYLNQVYYGNLAYGVEAAANVYFDKPASELTIGESAFLAGLVQAPIDYDPYTNFTAAKLRQRQVLDLMVKHGYINPRDADNAFNESPLKVSDLASPDVSLVAPHFTVAVRQELATLPGIDPQYLALGGLEIVTTLDPQTQAIGEAVVADQVAAIREKANLNNAALVAINPNTGEVLAMVGSVNYDDKSIDGNVNVILSPQQPGSSIKPLTYAAALEQGMLPSDILWDIPTKFDTGPGGEPYEPVNYDSHWHGPVRMRDALANSYNIPAVLTLQRISVPGLLTMADRLGIKSFGSDPSKYGLALTLGGGELTPLELTSAYGAFANGGKKVTPHLIARVTTSGGQVLYEAPTAPGEQVLDPRIAYLISDMLSDNDARTPAMGPASPLKLDFPVAAKTGTTNDYRDNWTIGYTPLLVVGVWAGNTDNSPMAAGTSGLTGAAPIWHDFMTQVFADSAITDLLTRPDLPALNDGFTAPPGLEKRPVCILSSLKDPALAANGCPVTRLEWFPVGPLSAQLKPTDSLPPTVTPQINPTTGAPYPPTRADFSPGLVVIGVQPLDDALKQTFFPISSVPVGSLIPAQPIYCEIPPQFADTPGLSLQLFIAAPADPVEATRVRNWALANAVPIDPGVVCPQAMVDQLRGAGGFDPAAGATYSIDSPKSGEGVYGVIPVLGTATFDPGRIEYYRVDIGAGTSPTEWKTIGDTHSKQVVHGELEFLHSDALPPGPYVLRLILVKNDGNFLQPTFDVPIIILSEPPTPTALP